MKPTAIVLNMHYTGLALARALKAHGFRVHGLSADPKLLGNWSRCITFHLAPDTQLAPDAAVRYLLRLAATADAPPLLLPTRDHDLNLLRAHRSQLEGSFVLPMAPNEVLDRILDKEQLYVAADQLGQNRPLSFWVRGPDDFAAALPQVPFPCLVKPVSASDWRRPGVWEVVGKRKAVILPSRTELERFYGDVSQFEPRLCIQEYIDGGDNELVIFGSYTGRRGGCVSYTARKLLQYPELAGTGVAMRSCEVPEILEPSRMLLDALHYVGPSEIEYKYDRSSGTFKLIEINTRFWDQHALGAACGADLVSAMIEDYFGSGVVEAHASNRIVTWLAEDAFITSLKAGRSGLSRREVHREALRGKKVFAVWSSRDPIPGIRLALRIAGDLFAGVIRGLLHWFGVSWTRRRSALN